VRDRQRNVTRTALETGGRRDSGERGRQRGLDDDEGNAVLDFSAEAGFFGTDFILSDGERGRRRTPESSVVGRLGSVSDLLFGPTRRGMPDAGVSPVYGAFDGDSTCAKSERRELRESAKAKRRP